MTTLTLKQLIFAPPYPEILFNGIKNRTFRVTGGGKFAVGDWLSFVYPDLVEFAQAQLADKYRKSFENLTDEDWKGHERFKSESEMYKIYSAWEGFQIGPKTEVDILVYRPFMLTGEIDRKSVV